MNIDVTSAKKPKPGRFTRHSKILLVDDVPDILFIFTQFLECNGADVFSANTGAEALRVAKTELPDLILLDMHLPDMDGCLIATKLREAGYDRPIIAMTARSEPGKRTEALASGCSYFLTKPVDYSLLIDTVSDALEAGASISFKTRSTTTYSH